MSTGRRNDRTYTQTHGGQGRSGYVSRMDAMLRGPASLSDRAIGPSPEEMRRAIGNGQCPFCGKEFKNIAAHTNRAHGVDRHQLKEMAGIPKSKPACAPEFSAEQSDRMIRELNDDPERLAALRASFGPSKTRQYSEAGKEVNREKLKLARTAQARKWSLEGQWDPEEWSSYMHDRLAESRNAHAANRDPKLVASVLDGATLQETADRFEVCPETVRKALKKAGVQINLRSRRMENPVLREKVREALVAGTRRRAERKRQRRVARWAETEQDWAAVQQMAQEWQVPTSTVVAWLKKHDQPVPDGRKNKPPRPERTHCVNGHDYAVHGRITPQGKQICRTCEYVNKRRYLERKRRGD